MLVGDIHIADKPPSIRTDDYADQILAKLDQSVRIAQDEDVDAVVWVGDVFHVKTPSRTSHALVQRIARIGQRYGRAWIVVPGNHDMSHDRMDSLEKQPLGVLYKAGAIMGNGVVTFKAGSRIGQVYCVPWLQDDVALRTYMQEWQDCVAPLLVAHLPIMPPGASVPYDFIDSRDFAEQMYREGHVFYGHIHDNHGIYTVRYTDDPDIHETHTYQFCNMGAISRGSLHEETLKRKPQVVLYNSDAPNPFTPVELEHLPANEVFKLQIKEEQDAKAERLGEFLQTVSRTELEGLSVEAVLAHVESLDLSEQTRQQIKECLEVALA